MDTRTIWVADHFSNSVAKHVHDYYQLLFCLNQEGIIQINDVDYPARDNLLFLIPPMVPHAINSFGGLRLLEIKFLLGTENPDSLLDALAYLPCCFTLTQSAHIRAMLTGIIQEGFEKKPFCNARTNALLVLFLTHCIKEIADVPSEELQTLNLCSSPLIESIDASCSHAELLMMQTYIEQNLTSHISLDDLASIIHFNKSYVIKIFKDLLGTTPLQYINELRLERSKELLAATSLSITEIAFATGFQSIHYFSRYFKSKECYSPLLYRQRHLQKASMAL